MDLPIQRPSQLFSSSEPFLKEPLFSALSAYKLVTIVKYGQVSLYFHRKEFRRINLSFLRNPFFLALFYICDTLFS